LIRDKLSTWNRKESVVNNYAYLGVVRRASLHLLAAEDGAEGIFRLTAVTLGSGEPPEHSEIPLGEDEDHAILVRGVASGTWIHAASIVDRAGPILTLAVDAQFSGGATPATLRFPGG
jgi:hypothetical protein